MATDTNTPATPDEPSADKSFTDRAGQAVSDATTATVDAVSGAAAATGHAVSGAASATGHVAAEAASSTLETVKAHPVATAAVVAGAAAVVAGAAYGVSKLISSDKDEVKDKA